MRAAQHSKFPGHHASLEGRLVSRINLVLKQVIATLLVMALSMLSYVTSSREANKETYAGYRVA